MNWWVEALEAWRREVRLEKLVLMGILLFIFGNVKVIRLEDCKM